MKASHLIARFSSDILEYIVGTVGVLLVLYAFSSVSSADTGETCDGRFCIVGQVLVCDTPPNGCYEYCSISSSMTFYQKVKQECVCDLESLTCCHLAVFFDGPYFEKVEAEGCCADTPTDDPSNYPDCYQQTVDDCGSGVLCTTHPWTAPNGEEYLIAKCKSLAP